jgi:hypothetical protein
MKTVPFWDLGFGAYLGFGFWDLGISRQGKGFGIWLAAS